jgi:type I restriction enzyme M protein
LPTGLFYAQGVKANVVFFERRPGATTDTPATSELWVYDFRTNQHFTLKTKQLTRADLDDFVEKYRPGRRHERVEAENFKRWTYDEITIRPGFNLDIWADVRDESLEDTASLPEPAVIAEEIVANLTTALEQFAAVAAELNGRGGGVLCAASYAPPLGELRTCQPCACWAYTGARAHFR